MTTEQFVKLLKDDVKVCISSTMDCIVSPSPGAGIAERYAALPQWLRNLSAEDKEKVLLAMEYAGQEILFNLLAVIDGDNFYSPESGHFELYYVEGEAKTLLNNQTDSYLTDFFGVID